MFSQDLITEVHKKKIATKVGHSWEKFADHYFRTILYYQISIKDSSSSSNDYAEESKAYDCYK